MRPGIDSIGIGIGALIVDHEGRVFLMQRGEKAKNERGYWNLPGGAVDFGERMTAAVERELVEEFGITVAVEELLEIVEHILPNEQQHWIAATYLCSLVAGTPFIHEPEKCAAIGWFALNALPQPLTLTARSNLACYARRIGHASLAMSEVVS